MSKKMNELPIEWDVTIDLPVTWELIYKIILSIIKRQRKIRIRYTFLNNPLHRHQDMTVNDFWRIAYLGDDLKKKDAVTLD